MKKLFSLVSGLLVVASLLPAQPVFADSDVGVIVMAHGGGSVWNKTVKRAVKEADLPCPYKIFFGMGDTPKQVRELQGMVRDLEGKGAHTVVVVPLLISSFSEVARQWRYLLGVDFQPGFINNPAFPVERKSKIRWAEPLNDSAVVVEILLDRAREISSQPAKESVIIVSHGPNDESDNARWNQILQSVSERIRQRAGYHTVSGITLRDDAPSAVRSKAIQGFRKRVEALNDQGDRVLVVPLFLAPGGVEHKVGLELRGLSYVYNAKTLLPDSRISEWIRSQVP